jgi:hypothetical protein
MGRAETFRNKCLLGDNPLKMAEDIQRINVLVSWPSGGITLKAMLHTQRSPVELNKRTQ